MKNILRSILGGFVAAAFAVVAQAATLAPAAFSAGTVKGDVTYKLAGTSQYLALTAGTALPQGATIRTGAGSLAIIVFANGASATVRPSSEVEVTKFHQEAFTGPMPASGEPSVSETKIRVIDGAVVSKVSKLKAGSSFVVSSPVGAAGVRGTIFEVTYSAATGQMTVSTAEGSVVYTVTSNGTSFTVSAGQAVDGTTLINLSQSEIDAILDALTEVEPTPGPGPGGRSPGTTGPTLPSVDTTISVSVN